MACQNDCFSICRNFFYDLTDLSNPHRIEAVCWLIENQYSRVVKQCGGYCQPLLHSEGIGFVLMIFTGCKLYQLKHVWNIFYRALLDHRIQLQIFLTGEVGVKNRVFQYRSDLLTYLVCGLLTKPGKFS